MSGEFGEDFKPKGVEPAKEDVAEKHDPFRDERAFKEITKADEVKKAPDTTDKVAYKEGSGQEYSDWLAEHRTSSQIAADLEKYLLSAAAKANTLAKAGYSDVVSGGSYLAQLVSDGPGEVRNFMTYLRNYIEK